MRKYEPSSDTKIYQSLEKNLKQSDRAPLKHPTKLTINMQMSRRLCTDILFNLLANISNNQCPFTTKKQ